MKRIPVLLLVAACRFTAAAQDSLSIRSAAVVEEGKKLYRSEMASWTGTDIFLKNYKDQLQNTGGYLSYNDGQHSYCIFFSNNKQPSVLATITLDSTFSEQTARADNTPRSFTPYENILYQIRKNAYDAIQKDTLFKSYNNTSLNLVPLADSTGKRVYVLTGPKVEGVVIFGNDYLLTFDGDNKLADRKALHKNIMPMDYKVQGNTEEDVEGTIHTHLPETGDLITATDICTLMLYAKFAGWKRHIVVAENYISIWNCEQNTLIVIPKEDWEKMSKDQN